MEPNAEHIHPGPWGMFPDRYWSAYFGEKAPYYMGELEKLRNGQPLEFRWAAFFLSLPWMAYRKMYIITACAIILTLLEGTVEEGLYSLLDVDENTSLWTGIAITLIINVMMGKYANRVYLWDARRNIQQVLTEAPHLHEMDIIARITRRGGTSIGAAVLFMVGLVLFALLAANLFDLINA